jgi:hypothetical protein
MHMGATSDSKYSGDKTECVWMGTIFIGALISHESKSCRSVTLSSTEAEYYALSEVTEEMIFVSSFRDYGD